MTRWWFRWRLRVWERRAGRAIGDVLYKDRRKGVARLDECLPMILEIRRKLGRLASMEAP